MRICRLKNLKYRRGTVLLSKRTLRVNNIDTSICENREILESRSARTLSYGTKNLPIDHFENAPYRVGVIFF